MKKCTQLIKQTLSVILPTMPSKEAKIKEKNVELFEGETII